MDKHNPPVNRGKKSQHTDIYEQLRRVQQAGILDPCAYAPADFIGIFPYSYRAGEKIILIDGNKRTTLISSDGLPHGPYPRLIMMWIGKEVLRRKKILPLDEARKIPLGTSLAHFLRECGAIKATNLDGTLRPVGGKSYRALQNQFLRLANTAIHIENIVKGEKGAAVEWSNTFISERGFFWWNESDDLEGDTEAHILLSEEVFLRIAESCVPLDAVHVAELSASGMGLDVYAWTARRNKNNHRGYTRVTWEQLKRQFGNTYADTDQGRRDFRKRMRKVVKEVTAVWPAAGLREWPGGLVLTSKETPVPSQRDTLLS